MRALQRGHKRSRNTNGDCSIRAANNGRRLRLAIAGSVAGNARMWGLLTREVRFFLCLVRIWCYLALFLAPEMASAGVWAASVWLSGVPCRHILTSMARDTRCCLRVFRRLGGQQRFMSTALSVSGTYPVDLNG